MPRGVHKNAKVELISKVALFAGLSKSELGQVASIADEIDFPQDKVLIREGERGREFFVLLEGEAEHLVPALAPVVPGVTLEVSRTRRAHGAASIDQLGLFAAPAQPHVVVDELRRLDVNTLTPLAALQALADRGGYVLQVRDGLGAFTAYNLPGTVPTSLAVARTFLFVSALIALQNKSRLSRYKR